MLLDRVSSILGWAMERMVNLIWDKLSLRDDQSIQETKWEFGEVGSLKDGTCGYVEESTAGGGIVEDMIGEREG